MVLPSNRKSSTTKVGAIYARYSSKYQHSIKDQVRVCKDWAEKNGITVPDELIFIDEAKKGKSSRRQGLKDFQRALVENRADVAIMFTTSRLYRKVYQSLAFVEEEIVDRGKRAVFVRSGPLDTDETEHWRQLLQMYALIDEFVVAMTAEHVRAAHEGLLLQCRVFGTLTYGYAGEDIPNVMTHLGKPARRLVKDPAAAEWVTKIYDWFTKEKLSIRAIARSLNAAKAPLPKRGDVDRWTRTIVRRILTNTRYRGLWEYGRTKAIWLNKPGYSVQVEREEPLASQQIESLRIIGDAQWYQAQERLGDLSRNAGRPPVDGDRQSRPRVLNAMIFCPKHNQALHVCGTDGKYMACKKCREEAEPELYSLLPRLLALNLFCERAAELIQADDSLVDQTLGKFGRHLQTLLEPDPTEAAGLERDIERLTRQINFILDAPGETEQDQKENRDRLAKLRSERAGKQKRLAAIKEAARKPKVLPSADEMGEHVRQLAATLREASHNDDPAEVAALEDLIRDLTGGRIVATQQGEKSPHKGWLRLTFQIDVLKVLAQRYGFPAAEGEPIAVEIDVKEADWRDQKCEEVKALYDQDVLEKDIADQLGLHRSQVSMLLKHWEQKRGQKLPDGRKRRATLARKQRKTPVYKEIADAAKELWSDPTDLAVVEIARRLETTDTTVWKALAHWYRSHGLPAPTAKQRRERIMARAKAMFDDLVEIKEIASVLGYTTRGMKLLLKEVFARAGEAMPDCRARRHQCKKAG